VGVVLSGFAAPGVTGAPKASIASTTDRLEASGAEEVEAVLGAGQLRVDDRGCRGPQPLDEASRVVDDDECVPIAVRDEARRASVVTQASGEDGRSPEAIGPSQP
jgi:hypothetical protein